MQSAVDETMQVSADSEPLCREAAASGDIRRLWRIMDAEGLVDYVYRNFDALKLLLKCFDGTPCSDFLNGVVSRETDLSFRAGAAHDLPCLCRLRL